MYEYNLLWEKFRFTPAAMKENPGTPSQKLNEKETGETNPEEAMAKLTIDYRKRKGSFSSDPQEEINKKMKLSKIWK